MSLLIEETARHGRSTAECHYCGFETEANAIGAHRCPKCGGSSWSIHAAADSSAARTRLHHDPSAAMGMTQVRFELLAPATQAYVFIGAEGGRRRMIPLRRLRRDRWELQLPLPPQTYHYRFYIDDGEHLLYFDPVTSTTSAHHGADATLRIEGRNDIAA
jgi:1,4-alpha-glucan branching enzyme